MSKDTTIPAGLEGWEAWCQKHLDFLKEHLKSEDAFPEFCSKLKNELDILDRHYDEDLMLSEQKEKTDREKELGKHLLSFRKNLLKARKNELFKDLTPDFFISLLIECCETEYCKSYTKGTRDINQHRAKFIAKTANLIYEFTGTPFQYNSKADPLCRVVMECIVGIGKTITDSGVRDAITSNIEIIATTPSKESLPSSSRFDYEQLNREKAKTDNLPRGYLYEEAVTRYKPRGSTAKSKDGFRHSFIIGHFLLGKLQSRPEEMIHPNLRLWIDYMSYKAIEARDKRARLLIQWVSNINPKKIPERISRDDVCCRWLTSKFLKQGDAYSKDDILEIIHSSVNVVTLTDSGKSDYKNVQYENISPGILELPCKPSDVVNLKPIILNPIPIACPADLDPRNN